MPESSVTMEGRCKEPSLFGLKDTIVLLKWYYEPQPGPGPAIWVSTAMQTRPALGIFSSLYIVQSSFCQSVCLSGLLISMSFFLSLLISLSATRLSVNPSSDPARLSFFFCTRLSVHLSLRCLSARLTASRLYLCVCHLSVYLLHVCSISLTLICILRLSVYD